MPELYPYQYEDVSRMVRGSCLNANDMGLGKTPEAIETINCLNPRNVLVICPATIKLNWLRECQTWLRRPLGIRVIAGKNGPMDLSASQIVIINYDILASHISELHSVKWDLMIVDESHYIKNLTAYRTAAVLGLTHVCAHNILMTGTPIMNRPVELIPQLMAIGALDESKVKFFRNRYCNPVLRRRNGGRYWDYSGHANLDELAEGFKPWMIRRKKSEVLTQLPSKVRQVVELGTEGIEGEYDTLIRTLKAAGQGDDWNAYRRNLRDLEASISVEFGDMSRVCREEAEAKAPLVIEYLQSVLEGGNKIVCFAHHTVLIDAIHKAFKRKSVTLTGKHSSTQKQKAIDTFVSDPKIQLFIGNIEAAGIGVDGLQKVCSRVIFAELDWVPGRVTQAEDRCHRIGQKDSVLVQHLVRSGTMDVLKAHILVAKQAVIERVVG